MIKNIQRGVSFVLVAAMLTIFLPSVLAVNTKTFTLDGMSVSYTEFAQDHTEVVVESDSITATTVRDGNHIIITTVNKKNSSARAARAVPQVIEFDLNSNTKEILNQAITGTMDDSLVTPYSVPPIKWMSYHYPGDGYQTWPSDGYGSYLLILQNNRIYAGTVMSSTLRGYVNTFVSKVKAADDAYQAAVIGLVDQIPIVGAAKIIAQLIGALGGVNNNQETWISLLTSITGISTIPGAISIVRNAMNAYNCHESYVNAYNRAYPYCTPW